MEGARDGRLSRLQPGQAPTKREERGDNEEEEGFGGAKRGQLSHLICDLGGIRALLSKMPYFGCAFINN
jgi:hypothetical protein